MFPIRIRSFLPEIEEAKEDPEDKLPDRKEDISMNTEHGEGSGDDMIVDEDIRINSTGPEDVDKDIDDDVNYDTDIEVSDSDINPVKEDDVHVGTVCYKRSCSQLNIKPEVKVVDNLPSSHLILAHQGLGEDGAKALAKSLLKNTTVERVNLEDNSITPLGVTFMMDMLNDNIYITQLDLSHNDVGTYGCMALQEMLLTNRTLTHLSLAACKIKDSDAWMIAEGIQKNDSIVLLDLSHNELCEEGAVQFGNALGINNSIEHLNLSWNHLRKQGAVSVCRSLKRNVSLVKVDLSWNGLGYEGSLALGRAINTNNYLRELDISSNRITWNCAAAIASGLKLNSALEHLKIGLNPLMMSGVQEILTAVKSDRSEVEYISFEGIPINHKIAYQAERISKTREFSISHGGVIDTKDIVGTKLVEEDTPLTRLMNFLDDRGMRAMDLFKSMEKGKDLLVSPEQFIDGLKKAQAPLEVWEMRQIILVLDRAEDGSLDFRKLADGMKEQKILNKKHQDEKKEAEKRKRREERQLLNPGWTPKASKPRLSISARGSIGSSMVDGNSRRPSRISLTLSHSIQDLRRPSSVSGISTRSQVNTNPALLRAVNDHRRDSRADEIGRKLDRIDPSSRIL